MHKKLLEQWKIYASQNDINTTIHEMRHTFLSYTKGKIPAELLKMNVGHTKEMDTAGIYGHKVEGETERIAAILNGIFTPLLAPQK